MLGGVKFAPLVNVYPHAADARPKSDVLGDGHVPEEGVALEYEANLPLLNRQICCILICSTEKHLNPCRHAQIEEETCWALVSESECQTVLMREIFTIKEYPAFSEFL